MYVWLFAYYDAYNELQIKLLKTEKTMQKWDKNWEKTDNFYSITRVWIEI